MSNETNEVVRNFTNDEQAPVVPKPPKAEDFTPAQQAHVNKIVRSRVARERAKTQDLILRAESERDKLRMRVALQEGQITLLRDQLSEK